MSGKVRPGHHVAAAIDRTVERFYNRGNDFSGGAGCKSDWGRCGHSVAHHPDRGAALLIHLNKYQDRYRPLMEEALNRKVELKDIRLTIWPRIGARIGGFIIQDDLAFCASALSRPSRRWMSE